IAHRSATRRMLTATLVQSAAPNADSASGIATPSVIMSRKPIIAAAVKANDNKVVLINPRRSRSRYAMLVAVIRDDIAARALHSATTIPTTAANVSVLWPVLVRL